MNFVWAVMHGLIALFSVFKMSQTPVFKLRLLWAVILIMNIVLGYLEFNGGR